MKPSHAKFLALVGTVVLGAIQSGCKPSPSGPSPSGSGGPSSPLSVVGDPDKLVTISPVSTTECGVDYPVVVLVQSKKHTITWAAEGVNDTFWIKFVLDPSTAKPGNPWDPNNKAFKVDHQGTKFDSLKAASPTYYWYAIYYQNPDANPGLTACKDFASDHDTGVNIKR